MNDMPLTVDDAALIIGRLMIENHVLRNGLEELKKEQQALKDRVETMLPKAGPTLAIVERAKDTDASAPGET